MTNPPVIDGLLPCPFCGMKPIVIDDTVACDDPMCGIRPSTAKLKNIEARNRNWNHRAYAAQPEQAGDYDMAEEISALLKLHAGNPHILDYRMEGGFTIPTLNVLARLIKQTSGTPARDGRGVDEKKLIKQIRYALGNYKMFHQNSLDESKNFELVDAVTPSWEDNIKEGEIELDMLAEHIADYLKYISPAKATLPTAAGATDEETAVTHLCVGYMKARNTRLDDVVKFQCDREAMTLAFRELLPYLAAAGADKEDGGAK